MANKAVLIDSELLTTVNRSTTILFLNNNHFQVMNIYHDLYIEFINFYTSKIHFTAGNKYEFRYS